MATISIGRSSSYCLGCNKSADPNETGHFTQLGYRDNGQPGCGELWTAVTLPYARAEIAEDGTLIRTYYIGYVFENLRGLPLVGLGVSEEVLYPPTK